MSRLHCITPWQERKPSVLSEELLLAQKREEKTYVFVRHFFGQKNGGLTGTRTRDSRLKRALLYRLSYQLVVSCGTDNAFEILAIVKIANPHSIFF